MPLKPMLILDAINLKESKNLNHETKGEVREGVKMDLQQVKGFVELMKDIDSKNNLIESSKLLLPYMEWLVEQVEYLESERQNDKEIISKMAKRIKAFEEKYLYP